MYSTWLLQRKAFCRLLSLRTKRPETPDFWATIQSAQFTKHSVKQRLPTVWIKEALPFNLSMIVTFSLAPQSSLRSLNHFFDSLKPKVASWWGPQLCEMRKLRHTSWLYLFLWQISRSLNLALGDPWCVAITLCRAPCNYRHISHSSEDRMKNPCRTSIS